MLNFFKKSEQGGAGLSESKETNKKATKDEVNSEELKINKREEEELKEKTLNQTVSDINEYIKTNGKIDPETVELMAGTSLDKFLNNIEDREDLKLELNLSQLKEEVAKSIKTLEEPARENWWRKVVNKPAVKASFVALMLFLKFSPDAQASFNKDQDDVKDKTENVKDNQTETNDANTYNLSDADLENMSNDSENINEDNSSLEKSMSVDQFTDSQIEDIKGIINNQEYDKITANPYLVSALYYSQKFVNKISNEKYQTSAAKKIMGQVADLIDDNFREGALQALEEQTKTLEREQGKTISISEATPIASIDYGHGVNHNDAIDLYTPEGSDISAMSSGIVVLAETGWQEENEVSTSSTKGGNTVIIYNYLTQEFSRYAHLDEVNLEPGQLVMPGDKVGTVGHTGTNACKPGHGGHLHFEINAYNSDKNTNESILAPQLKDRIEDTRTLASN